MHKPLHLTSRIFFFLIVSLLFTQCSKEEGNQDIDPVFNDATSLSHEVATEWNKQMLEMERYTEGYKSPVAARSLAYINLAAYESIVPGMSDKYNSIAGQYMDVQMPFILKDQSYVWPIVMNSCYKKSLQNFYPTAPYIHQLHVMRLYENLHKKYSAKVEPSIVERSMLYGELIASKVFQWSQEDVAGDKAYLKNTDPTYVPPTGDGMWKPTFPDYAAPVLPHWGNIRVFSAEVSDFEIPAPMEYSTESTSTMFKQSKYVHDLTEAIRNKPQEENYWIAEFWSDDFSNITFTPAGRWTAIAMQVINNENSNLADAAMIYAKVSIALCDAGIGCWKNKYKYNVMRPVDYIRSNMDAGWNTILSPDITNNYYTPAAPSYPSEHATFGAATAGVLASIFGNQYKLTDRCHEGRLEFRSDPRTFYSFSDIAEEAAYSRLPLGVHYESDATAGLTLGNKIAARVNKMQFKK